jgi:hypothetical protein
MIFDNRVAKRGRADNKGKIQNKKSKNFKPSNRAEKSVVKKETGVAPPRC